MIYILERKIPYVPLIGAALISLFGGLALYFNNPIFIYLKPTIINLVFAAALLISDTFLKKNLLKLFLNNAFNNDLFLSSGVLLCVSTITSNAFFLLSICMPLFNS